MGKTVKLNDIPEIFIATTGVKPVRQIDLIRNSRVLKTWIPEPGATTFTIQYADDDYRIETKVLYYYVRVTQVNEQIAWSSPVFVQLT